MGPAQVVLFQLDHGCIAWKLYAGQQHWPVPVAVQLHSWLDICIHALYVCCAAHTGLYILHCTYSTVSKGELFVSQVSKGALREPRQHTGIVAWRGRQAYQKSKILFVPKSCSQPSVRDCMTAMSGTLLLPQVHYTRHHALACSVSISQLLWAVCTVWVVARRTSSCGLPPLRCTLVHASPCVTACGSQHHTALSARLMRRMYE
jgi:hypothetical protein